MFFPTENVCGKCGCLITSCACYADLYREIEQSSSRIEGRSSKEVTPSSDHHTILVLAGLLLPGWVVWIVRWQLNRLSSPSSSPLSRWRSRWVR